MSEIENIYMKYPGLDIGYDEFRELVDQKSETMNGLCGLDTAAMMVIHDLGGWLPADDKKPDLQSSERCIKYTQIYEISTGVSAEVDSKGNIKPAAQVEITRKLVDGEEVYDLVHADMQRGLEEVQQAIQEVLSRGGQ
jgi:hypothetical protein